MKECIEREAALDFNFSITVPGDKKIQVRDAVHNTVKAIAAHIETIPAADVVEVRHGIPDPIEEVYEDGAHVYRHIVGYTCPFCGSDRIAKYCADCGAKMDGGVNDGKAD